MSFNSIFGGKIEAAKLELETDLEKEIDDIKDYCKKGYIPLA